MRNELSLIAALLLVSPALSLAAGSPASAPLPATEMQKKRDRIKTETIGLVRGPELGMKPHSLRVGDGSVIRANNGWLVAALRTDMPARWIAEKNDNYEGCGVSISKDNGQTWSPLRRLLRGGRMHMHFAKMPDGALAMIYVMRQDIAPDGVHYASYRRGCCALVSRDNGLTWDLSREYRLHEFDFATSREGTPHEGIAALACGHTCSTLLSDGSILTAYGHYLSKGIALIRWKLPAAR